MEDREEVPITHYKIMVIVNPKSGSQKGMNLLEAYGDKPGHFEFKNGKSCDISLYNVIS